MLQHTATIKYKKLIPQFFQRIFVSIQAAPVIHSNPDNYGKQWIKRDKGIKRMNAAVGSATMDKKVKKAK